MIDACKYDAGPAQGGGSGLCSNQAILSAFMDAMEPMAANGALVSAFGASFYYNIFTNYKVI